MKAVQQIIHYLRQNERLDDVQFAALQRRGFFGKDDPRCDSRGDHAYDWEFDRDYVDGKLEWGIEEGEILERLARRTFRSRKPPSVKGKSLDAEGLRGVLRERFKEWERPLIALTRIAARLGGKGGNGGWQQAALTIRRATQEDVSAAVAEGRKRSDPTFEAYCVAEDFDAYKQVFKGAHGSAVNAYNALMNAPFSNPPGRYGWLLSINEVADVANLRAAQSRI